VINFTRSLMLAANNYQAKHGKPPSVRHVYVSQNFYECMCDEFGSRGDSYQGYKIMVVLNADHPDWLIYLL
jgi:hypothetical protein